MEQEQTIKLPTDIISFEMLMTALNKTEDDIEELYIGNTHGCRCGCGDTKYYPNPSTMITRTMTKLGKMFIKDNDNFRLVRKDIDYRHPDRYLDIPYLTKSGRERSICLYFKKDCKQFNMEKAASTVKWVEENYSYKRDKKEGC